MRRMAILAIPMLLAAGIGTARALDEDGVLIVQRAMQQEINAATNELWDVGNNAMNENGGIDPAQMDDAKWARLVASAGQLEQEAKLMAAAPTIRAAITGKEAAEEPGSFSMEDVQSYIDADPQAFREMAAALGRHAADIASAARARDVAKTGLLIGELDQVCESCHARYWYPQG